MNAWKKTAALLLILGILLSVAGGICWKLEHYYLVDFRFYPKDAETLDLRQESISPQLHDKLQAVMPDTEILWNIPFQGSQYPHDTRELTIDCLSEGDIGALAVFSGLEAVDVQAWEDPGLLLELRDAYPELTVRYALSLGGKPVAPDASVLNVDGIGEQGLPPLELLPELQLVVLESGKDPDQLSVLVEQCDLRQIPVQVVFGNRCYDRETGELTVTGLQTEDVFLLYLLPELEQVRLLEPEADAGSLLAYRLTHPEVDISWEKTILGTLCDTQMDTLDMTATISAAGAQLYKKAETAPVQGNRDPEPYLIAYNKSLPMPDRTRSTGEMIREVEDALDYFPNIQKVVLGGCLLDNDAMADFRDRHRKDYAVVWSVQLGDKMIARTDTPYFMPTKFHVYYFLDKDAGNLRYCEEIVAMDLGHMAVSDISWVEYMPELTYLVLAHSQVQYIEPIRSCKNLKFLELDWSPVKDYSPLTGCTALEDLNLGETYADITPIQSMTWLRNLWMVNCSRSAVYKARQALPEVNMVVSGDATVAGGWRNLPNYYAMRDKLGMYYMKW